MEICFFGGVAQALEESNKRVMPAPESKSGIVLRVLSPGGLKSCANRFIRKHSTSSPP